MKRDKQRSGFSSSDPVLGKIVRGLVARHHCHTVILCGSRARGDFTAASDYDILGLRTGGKRVHDARLVDGFYLDAVILRESDVKKATSAHLGMKDGVVLFESRRIGTNFLKQVARIFKRGPRRMSPDVRKAHRLWFQKTLIRIRAGGVQGHYRRLELLWGLVEKYFELRNRWFQGGKHALNWLRDNDRVTYKLFEKALARPTDVALLERLTRRVDC